MGISAPPPPFLVTAPNRRLVEKMMSGEVRYFTTVVATPCGTATFVHHCDKVELEDDTVTIATTHERFGHDTKPEDQQWYYCELVYTLGPDGECKTGGDMFFGNEDFMYEMPESFADCPTGLDEIPGPKEPVPA